MLTFQQCNFLVQMGNHLSLKQTVMNEEKRCKNPVYFIQFITKISWCVLPCNISKSQVLLKGYILVELCRLPLTHVKMHRSQDSAKLFLKSCMWTEPNMQSGLLCILKNEAFSCKPTDDLACFFKFRDGDFISSWSSIHSMWILPCHLEFFLYHWMVISSNELFPWNFL